MIKISEKDQMEEEIANLKMELRSRIEKLEKRLDALENTVSKKQTSSPNSKNSDTEED